MKRTEKLEEENTSLKVGNKAVQDKEKEAEKLRREVNHLKMKIKEMGMEGEKTEGRAYSSSNNYADQQNWPRARLVAELRALDGIIEKCHKENEKALDGKKKAEAEVRDLQDRLYQESKKIENYKHKVIKETGSVMIVEEEIDIPAMNDLGLKNAIG